MSKYDYKKIINKLEESLDEERFEHTLGVAVTARLLARVYDADEADAYVAGLLHDCAKNVSNKDKIKMCKDAGVEISDFEMENPGLLHAKAGAILAKKTYKIEDEDILNAIRFHTTGRPEMSLLEKIIYIADYIEPGRNERPGLKELRIEAFDDIDRCVAHVSAATLEFLKEGGRTIDPATELTREYYERNI